MDLERIRKNSVLNTDGCWVWAKSTNSSGYGQLIVGGKHWTAHRYSLSCVREVKSSDIVRHSCHNKKCCNPEHLKVGSHKDNYRDSFEKHAIAGMRARLRWDIAGVVYSTCREAVAATGLSMPTLIKYTEAGSFNISKYREGCRIAGWKPKV